MNQVFEGRLTLDHFATHVAHKFRVPKGTGTLRIAFSHSPRHPGVGSIAHQLSISVYGPAGARGTRHNNANQSPVISAKWASPGYLKGTIEPGEWVVEIDVHRILPPGNVSYRIEVDCDTIEVIAPPDELAPEPPQRTKRRGPGWYSGDLHGHTFHSDGDYSPAEYLDVAYRRKYDFVALTDHNTISALPLLRQLAGNGITVIGGIELTTFNGHAVVLGAEGWSDWRVKDGATMSGRAASLQNTGALYIIAHPKAEGHPFCTGCRWAYSDMLPGPARHVEVWNREWVENSFNHGSVRLFYQWLNSGFRMVATGGTDTHRPIRHGFRIAANRVYAQDNTQVEILAAIKRGHCYVSGGPELTFTGRGGDGSNVGMGDLIAPGPMQLSCGWSSGSSENSIGDLTARLICRGRVAECWPCSQLGEAMVEVKAEAGQWFLLELRDQDGELHAMTNPIYAGENGEHWQ